MVTVTSRTGVPGEDPITVLARMSDAIVDFTATSRVKVYANVYKGLTPVKGINALGIFELPDGSELSIALKDDGAGKYIRTVSYCIQLYIHRLLYL